MMVLINCFIVVLVFEYILNSNWLVGVNFFFVSRKVFIILLMYMKLWKCWVEFFIWMCWFFKV